MKLRSGRLTNVKATKITKKRVVIKKAPKKKAAPQKRTKQAQAAKPVELSSAGAQLKRLKRLDTLEKERKLEAEYIESVFPGLIAANEKRERLSQ